MVRTNFSDWNVSFTSTFTASPVSARSPGLTDSPDCHNGPSGAYVWSLRTTRELFETSTRADGLKMHAPSDSDSQAFDVNLGSSSENLLGEASATFTLIGRSIGFPIGVTATFAEPSGAKTWPFRAHSLF